MTEQQYGPWSATVIEPERGRQLRSMGALAHAMFGLNCPLVRALRDAETGDATALAHAHLLIEALPPLHRRRLLATFAAVTYPRTCRKTGGAP